jgi:glucose/arabinose dehydrogenase
MLLGTLREDEMKKLLLLATLVAPLSWAQEYQLETVAENLNTPWSMTFLPDGSYLVAHKVGEVRRLSATGELGEPIENGPETYFAGQGGYFDIILDPDFANSSTVYLSYAGGTPEANGTTIMRAKLADNSFENPETIYSAAPTKDTPQHYGGKLMFLPDNTLMLTTGDGFDYREASQDKQNQLGKIIRLRADGSVPSDNPFVDDESGDPFVYSYGHRNPQGLTMDPESGVVYVHEHGPKGGDEVNLVAPGANYGWPAVTYGDNYSGAYVSPLKQAPGLEEPMHVWTPSIAPSGMVFYTGEMFPEWQGNVFVGALVDQEVRMLELEGSDVTAETEMFSEIGERIRDVRQGPSGAIYLVTDGPSGKIIRVTR